MCAKAKAEAKAKAKAKEKRGKAKAKGKAKPKTRQGSDRHVKMLSRRLKHLTIMLETRSMC